MRQPPGRRVPLEPEEDEDEEMTTPITPGQMNSTNPADMALAATDAAWRAYRASLIDRGALAGRWSNVAQAMAHAVDAVCQTEDRYAVKEDAAINPHQRIGVLSDDEIETVMALRRGERFVSAKPGGAYESGNDASEPFEDWARRQIDKLAAQVNEMARDAKYPPHAGERVDPVGIGTQIHAAAEQFALPWPDTDESHEAHMGRLMWCALYVAGVPSLVIPEHVWDQSGGARLTITKREDGGRLIRRS